jgi:hypothetical protein
MSARQRKPREKQEDPLAIAKAAWSKVRSLERAVELKHYQVGVTTTNYLAGVVSDISTITQGVTAQQRIGESVRLKHLSVRGKVGSITDSNMTFRVMLVIDKQQVASTSPALTTYLTIDATASQRSDVYDDRFVVVKDATFDLAACFLNEDVQESFEWELNLGNMEARFLPGGGHSSNGLYLMVTADYLAAGAPFTKPALGDALSGMYFDLAFTDA